MELVVSRMTRHATLTLKLTSRNGLTGVGPPFGGRELGKPMKVGRTWGYGWGGVRTNDVHAVQR